MVKQQLQSRIVCDKTVIDQSWAGIPGIEVTPGGRLIVVFYSGGEREPAPENTVFLVTSDDGGRSFSSPAIVAAPRDGMRAFDPTLWLDPQGALWLIFNRGDKLTARHGVYARVCTQPDASTLQWRQEFHLDFGIPFSFRMNKPIVLSTGEWVLPVTYADHQVYDWFAGESQLQGVAISRSDRNHWDLYGAVVAPHWALENMVVACRDGALQMYIRAGGGVLWQSRSTDRGRTWSSGAPTTIPNPGSRFFVRKLPDGAWLLINSPNPEKRTGIVASLSGDEGHSWQGRLVLDERDNVSYPDAAIAQDGTIYAVHDRDRQGAGEILLTVFRKEHVT
jgi:predicted neuraminidase